MQNETNVYDYIVILRRVGGYQRGNQRAVNWKRTDNEMTIKDTSTNNDIFNITQKTGAPEWQAFSSPIVAELGWPNLKYGFIWNTQGNIFVCEGYWPITVCLVCDLLYCTNKTVIKNHCNKQIKCLKGHYLPNRNFLLLINTIRYDWCLNKTCFCN